MANGLSVIRMILSISLLGISPTSVCFWVIYTTAGITDLLDGSIARKTNTTSELGGKLDSIGDLIMALF